MWGAQCMVWVCLLGAQCPCLSLPTGTAELVVQTWVFLTLAVSSSPSLPWTPLLPLRNCLPLTALYPWRL